MERLDAAQWPLTISSKYRLGFKVTPSHQSHPLPRMIKIQCFIVVKHSRDQRATVPERVVYDDIATVRERFIVSVKIQLNSKSISALILHIRH